MMNSSLPEQERIALAVADVSVLQFVFNYGAYEHVYNISRGPQRPVAHNIAVRSNRRIIAKRCIAVDHARPGDLAATAAVANGVAVGRRREPCPVRRVC